MVKQRSKQFLFLYPIEEYFDFDIGNGAYGYYANDKFMHQPFVKQLKTAKTKEEKEKIKAEAKQAMKAGFRKVFSRYINDCLNQRYRQKGFAINFAVFKGHKVSDVLNPNSNDNIFEVPIDFKTHCSQKKYPNSDFLLDSLVGSTTHLRVCGYHLWDCVDRVAERAYNRGIHVLVDEDLTELFEYRFRQPDFKIGTYPSFNPHNQSGGEGYFEMFMDCRKSKPWLWQKY